jgi:hypothetical protein
MLDLLDVEKCPSVDDLLPYEVRESMLESRERVELWTIGFRWE